MKSLKCYYDEIIGMRHWDYYNTSIVLSNSSELLNNEDVCCEFIIKMIKGREKDKNYLFTKIGDIPEERFKHIVSTFFWNNSVSEIENNQR